MKAVYLNDYGSVDNFKLDEAPRPEPGPDDVLVKVHFAGLRWGDIMARNGFPARRHSSPFIAGQEAAGVIKEVGARVENLKPGMRVIALPLDGAYAEYVSVSKDRISIIPDNVPMEKYLAYPVNMRTAYMLIYAWGKIQPGETVLLHAAAGGVGTLALQVMKRRLNKEQITASITKRPAMSKK
jgi:NADPH2:quinone reductase